MTVAPRLGAAAVVIHDGAVLLVKRGKAPSKGKWSFPGGRVEPGETGLAAALRELTEETGVTATDPQYLTNTDAIGYDTDGNLTHHYLIACVLCRYANGTPVPADDADDARWVPLDEVSALDITDRVLPVIRLGLDASEIAPSDAASLR